MVNNILIIGGDSRQHYIADFLDKYKFNLFMYGINEEKKQCEKNLKKAMDFADAVILPLPVSKDGKYITSSVPVKESLDEIISMINDDCIVFAGMISRSVEAKLNKRKIKYYDYFKREDLTIKNTIPTVQGILKTIIDNIDYTVHSSKCAVFGYGRVGKITADVLKSLGADVTVCVRKNSDLSVAHTKRMDNCLIKDFYEISNEFDILINTVPSLVIDRSILENLNKNCLIIDVASAPYGTDFATANEFGINAIQCPSLPGKVAPKTAGIIIGEAIIDILKEENLWMN